MCALVHNHWGDETLFVGVGADELCATEWFYLRIMYLQDHITHEELIDAFYIAPDSVQIK